MKESYNNVCTARLKMFFADRGVSTAVAFAALLS